MSKKILAIFLSALLIAAMVPFTVFAADYMTAEGRITSFGPNYFTVSVHGRDVPFFISDSIRYELDTAGVGDKVRVLFDPAQPDTAVQVTVTHTPSRPESGPSHYSISGTVTDATSNTITIMTSHGVYRSFSKEDAQITASDGILLGDTVRITYDAYNQEIALAVKVTKNGSNHHSSVQTGTISRYSATGTVSDATMNAITIIGQNTGDYRTFGKADNVQIIADDGILLGDIVRITYHRDNPTIAVKIEMVREGSNH